MERPTPRRAGTISTLTGSTLDGGDHCATQVTSHCQGRDCENGDSPGAVRLPLQERQQPMVSGLQGWLCWQDCFALLNKPCPTSNMVTRCDVSYPLPTRGWQRRSEALHRKRALTLLLTEWSVRLTTVYIWKSKCEALESCAGELRNLLLVLSRRRYPEEIVFRITGRLLFPPSF